MHLYLIRHGQSENNALEESLRVKDPGLTEAGLTQVDYLGKWFSVRPLDVLITSPFRRAQPPSVAKIGLEQHGCKKREYRADLRAPSGMTAVRITNAPRSRVGLQRDAVDCVHFCLVAIKAAGWIDFVTTPICVENA